MVLASHSSPRPPSGPSFSPFGLAPAFAGGPPAPLFGGPARPRTDWTDRLTPRGGRSASLVQGTGRAPTLAPRVPAGRPLPGPAPDAPRPPSRPGPPRPAPGPAPARRGPASGALRGRLAVAAVAAGALATAGHSMTGLESLAPSEDATTAELALAARGTPEADGATSSGGTGGSVLDAATAGVLPVPAAGTATPGVSTGTPSSTTAGGSTGTASGPVAGQVTSLAKAAQRAAGLAAARDAAAHPGFVKPAEGRLTSGFGARWGRSHRGIDIANAIGTPIVSVGDGEVIESGPASGFGMWVRVRLDDGTVNVYGHVNRSYVREGQRVRAGEEIAEIGNRGESTGPHLHFEVWLDGSRKINPLPWLAERGISLGSPQD